jgi:uncharacterized membrane protein
MAEIIVVGFKRDRERAAAVLGELRETAPAWSAQFHGAIAVTSPEAGELAVDQSFESTKGEHAIVHGMLGSLLGIALATLALPVTAAAGATIAAGAFVAGALGGAIAGAHNHQGDTAWWLDDMAIPPAFLAQVRELIQPGDSAICVLLATRDPDDVAARFAPYGGTVIRCAFTPAQADKLAKRLHR